MVWLSWGGVVLGFLFIFGVVGLLFGVGFGWVGFVVLVVVCYKRIWVCWFGFVVVGVYRLVLVWGLVLCVGVWVWVGR